jgi:hypothetical protein
MPTTKAKKSAKKSTSKTSKLKAAPSQGKCSSWKAVLNMFPPGPTVLRVTGKCRFPTHGYKVTLKVAVPQGINPAILLLKKTVKPPTGIVIKTPEVVNVVFTMKTKTKYQKVTILPDGTTIPVQIIT